MNIFIKDSNYENSKEQNSELKVSLLSAGNETYDLRSGAPDIFEAKKENICNTLEEQTLCSTQLPKRDGLIDSQNIIAPTENINGSIRKSTIYHQEPEDNINTTSTFSIGPRLDEEQQADGYPEEQEEIIDKVRIVFLKAVRQFLSGMVFSYYFSLAKIFFAIIVLLGSSDCGYTEYQLWVIILLCQSVLCAIYNRRSMTLMKNPIFSEQLAIDMHQIDAFPFDAQEYDGYAEYLVEDVPQDGSQGSNNLRMIPFHRIVFDSSQNQEEDYRKSSQLVLQLKFECKKRDKIAMLTGYSQFFMHVGLQAWAIISFVFMDQFLDKFASTESDCIINIYRFILVVVLLGLFQYLDYYIIFVLFVFCSVFILAGLIFYLFKSLREKRRRSKFIKKLQPEKYGKIQSRKDKDCSICLSTFEEEENIIILPCQAHHYFHDECIRDWLKVNSTCPMCRATFNNPQ